MNPPLQAFDVNLDLDIQAHQGWDFVQLIGALGQSFFHNQHSSGSIYRTPGEDSHNWVHQTTPYACAVVSQERILHEFGINARLLES